MLLRVRGDSQAEYAAVRRETGEVRFLGLLGVDARGASTLPAHSKAATPTVALLPSAAESCALKLGTLVLDGVVELPMRARAVVSFNYGKTPFTVGYLIKRYGYEARGFMKSVLDASFKYTPSFETDVRKTFHRVRRRQVQTSSRVLVTNSRELKDAVLTLEQFKKKSRAY